MCIPTPLTLKYADTRTAYELQIQIAYYSFLHSRKKAPPEYFKDFSACEEFRPLVLGVPYIKSAENKGHICWREGGQCLSLKCTL
jgi:hypothetical protein